MISMKPLYKVVILFVVAFAGFMVVMLFQSPQHPDDRDTRDTWELRSDIQEQQKKQQQLYAAIQEAEETINQYGKESVNKTTDTLQKSVQTLKQEAGLTAAEGKGIVFSLAPLFQENISGQAYPQVSPVLLNRLINELNKYGATDIAINNERVISLTPIRDVNGGISVNDHPVSALPFEITVLVDHPKKLLGHMEYSNIRDNFAAENINITGVMKKELKLPAYDQEIYLDAIDIQDAIEADGE